MERIRPQGPRSNNISEGDGLRSETPLPSERVQRTSPSEPIANNVEPTDLAIPQARRVQRYGFSRANQRFLEAAIGPLQFLRVLKALGDPEARERLSGKAKEITAGLRSHAHEIGPTAYQTLDYSLRLKGKALLGLLTVFVPGLYTNVHQAIEDNQLEQTAEQYGLSHSQLEPLRGFASINKDFARDLLAALKATTKELGKIFSKEGITDIGSGYLERGEKLKELLIHFYQSTRHHKSLFQRMFEVVSLELASRADDSSPAPLREASRIRFAEAPRALNDRELEALRPKLGTSHELLEALEGKEALVKRVNDLGGTDNLYMALLNKDSRLIELLEDVDDFTAAYGRETGISRSMQKIAEEFSNEAQAKEAEIIISDNLQSLSRRIKNLSEEEQVKEILTSLRNTMERARHSSESVWPYIIVISMQYISENIPKLDNHDLFRTALLMDYLNNPGFNPMMTL